MAVTEEALKPCPFCDGPTATALNLRGELVRHEGEPHCPVIRCAITAEQWNHRATRPQAIGEDMVEAVMAAISAEADKRPTGEGLVFSYGEVERGTRAALEAASLTRPSSDEVVAKRCEQESLRIFPQWLRDGHAYHPTAFVLDKAAAALLTQGDTNDRMRGDVLNDIAVMMSEFVDNWPNPKKVETALALIAKTMRAALHQPIAQEVSDSPWIKALGAPWVRGLGRTDGPPLPSGAVNLETGERRMLDTIRFRWVPSGSVQPDELTALRERHAQALSTNGKDGG